jgi:hypothetical protein
MITPSTSPLPSKVTATNVKEELVAVIERDGLRLGTAADAGRICVTSRSPGGVSGDMYRYYVREQRAPGPFQVRDPITRKPVSARDEQGRELFDLDAVQRWNAERPGPGARVQPGRPVKFTQLRHDLIAGASEDRLHLRAGRPWLGDEELRSRQVQRLGELVEAGLLRRPAGERGRFKVTAAGRKWLAEQVPAPPG